MIVAIDEFQEVHNLDGVNITKRMMAHFQTHKHSTLLVDGSQEHLLRPMAEGPEAQFYRFFKSYHLGPIDRIPFVAFIRERFESTDREILESIIQASVVHSEFMFPISSNLLHTFF